MSDVPTSVEAVADAAASRGMTALAESMRPPMPAPAVDPTYSSSIRLPLWQLAAVDEIARQRRCRRSDVLRAAVTEFLEREVR